MPIPQVVIVGRPNVGKSSLFNWLSGKRLSITDAQAGVTRDRLTYLMHQGDKYFDLVDTGGLGFEDVGNLSARVDEQINAAIESATVVLFVLDTLDGLVPLDLEVYKRLRDVQVPILCVANKADAHELEPNADEFFKLGYDEVLKVSVKANRGREELLQRICRLLPRTDLEAEQDSISTPEMKLAIVGRQNAGKSTFINALAQAERVITSEIPGTTRDSIDVRFEVDGKKLTAIDTPGLTRSKSVKTNVDYYSVHRAKRSIRRADVVLLFLDGLEHISRVDKQLCDYVVQQYKPCMFVVNKWDLCKSTPTSKWARYLRDQIPMLQFVPIAFITAKTGKNAKTVVNHAQMLFKQARERATTSDLNKLIKAAIEHTPPPLHHHRPAKIYYATQVGIEPPTFVLFCNDPQAFPQSYRRFLERVFRDNLPFAEVPLKLYFRKRQTGEGEPVPDSLESEK